MNLRSTFLALFIMVSFGLASQCNISALTAVHSECNSSGDFYVTINFTHAGTSDHFSVQGNGVNYGNSFSYANLPIILGPLDGNCTTNYEFVVRDMVNESCLAFTNIGTICCQNTCSLSIINAEASDCNDGKYTLSLNLNHENAPDNGFDLYNNGTYYGYYQYSQLPLHLENFPSSNFELYNKIVVCANDNNACCDTISILNPCICSIYKVRGQVVECSNDLKKFDLKLNFKHRLTSDSFQVGGNSVNYGKFAYTDLPITLKNIPFSPTIDYEFLIVDKNDAFCFGTYPLGIVNECNFHCEISNVHAIPTECVDGNFYVFIDFDEKNTSLAGFIVRGNGHIYDTLEYGDDHYKIGPLKGDCVTKYEFIVKDLEIPECNSGAHFSEPICCDSICSINELQITEHCENHILQSFDVNFHHTKTTGHFVLKINNKVIGTFAYSDLPLHITNFDFDFPNVVFRIFDTDNEACNLIKEYHFECAPPPLACNIYDMVVTASDCNAVGSFYARLKFKVTSPGNHGFIVKVNGVIWDTLEYGHDVYEIGPLAGDCETIYKFLIQDVAKPDCREDAALPTKICCGECKINELQITEHCENHILQSFDVNFHHTKTTGHFVLKINTKVIGTFAYSDLPLNITNFDFDFPNVVFRIFDTDNEACNLVKEYHFECAPTQQSCNIYDMVVTDSDCNAVGSFYARLKFKVTSPGNHGFIVKVNGVIWDTLEYGHDVYEIGPLAGDCETIYKFLIQDVANPDCREDAALPTKICCGECKISNPLVTIILPCHDGKYNLKINFDHVSNTQKFRIKINGVVKGPFLYSSLPIILENFEQNKSYTLVIQDIEKEICHLEFALPAVECTSEVKDAETSTFTMMNDNQSLTLQYSEQWKPSDIKVVDLSGRMVMYQKANAINVVDISTLISGLYILQLSDGHKIVCKKFIKL